MAKRGTVRVGLAVAAIATLALGVYGAPGHAPKAERLDFNRYVRPILDKCLSCHGKDRSAIQAGLRLDTRQSATMRLMNGERAIVPGRPEQSELIKRIDSAEPATRMPPPSSNRVLSTEERAVLREWIRQGAEYKPHWAFVRPIRPATPRVAVNAWPKSPIDSFVLAGLEARGLRPSREADRGTLLRRVTLDLTGLPPTPSELDAFERDPDPNAYERVVDRLLASPRYGERMAMEWLDNARYADSNGYQNDYERYQYRWRDWVIDAFNRNMPYDEFTIEQLAGDLLPHPTLDQIIATGFCRNNRLNSEGGAIPEEYHDEYVMDRVQTMSAVWLGLTTGCARCHDHKYDPVTQRDFYSLCAYFNNVPETDIGDEAPKNYPPTVKAPYPEQAAAMDHMNSRIANLAAETGGILNRAMAKGQTQSPTAFGLGLPALDAPPENRGADETIEARLWLRAHDPRFRALDDDAGALKKRRDALDAAIPTVMVMQESPQPRDMFILVRGLYDHHGPKVTAATPAFLTKAAQPGAQDRLALARWIVSPDNPLTARVTVNRMWERLFGTGIVETSEDFGTRSSFPSHPELLDWLATELIARRWNLKAMWKELVLSATYRQSSDISPKLLAIDPANRLLARGPRFRLPAEVIRDQAMYAGGFLSEKIGGPSVRPYEPAGVWDETAGLNGNLRNYKNDTGPNLHRRSLYTIWKRTAPPPDMVLFDAPSREVCTVRRARTDTPLQALTLLNNVAYVEAARGLAQRILRVAHSPGSRIDLAFRIVLSRRPSPAETKILTAAIERNLAHYKANPKAAAALVHQGELPPDPKLAMNDVAAYTLVASILLNMDEAVTKK
jgi:hypothetical protein